jgi:hypothetical protein
MVRLCVIQGNAKDVQEDMKVRLIQGRFLSKQGDGYIIGLGGLTAFLSNRDVDPALLKREKNGPIVIPNSLMDFYVKSANANVFKRKSNVRHSSVNDEVKYHISVSMKYPFK